MAGLGCRLFDSLGSADRAQLESQWGMRRILALLDAQACAVHEHCKLRRRALETFIKVYVGGSILDEGAVWRVRLDDMIYNELCIQSTETPTNDKPVSIIGMEMHALKLLTTPS